MTDAFRYLCLLMDMDNPRISAYEASMWPDDGFKKILAQGFLQLAENAECVTCPECFDYQEEIICSQYPGGVVRWFIACPECGRVQLEPDKLRQWGINCGSVAQAIASSLSLTGKCTEIAPGHVWRLGRWKLPDGTRDVLFAVGLTSPNGSILRRAITSSPRPVVLVPRQVPPEEFWVGKVPPLISLHDAAEFMDDQIILDPQYVLDVVRQDELEPDRQEPMTLEKIKLMIQREVRTQGKVQITNDLLIAAYAQCGTYRDAAAFLSKESETDVGKDRVRRAVIKARGGKAGVSDKVSNSIVRSTGRDRRDTAPDRLD
jgi:hypothetical protein